ncbi:MAG: 16S rRNA (adenine(1518)-N(6)/adenine(1519)-N(6))-dimethyltransferase RsmA [Planctomycetota bacterium]
MTHGATPNRPAWTAVRAVLERAGFRPSRRFGQNFLLDENMVRAIVRDAEVGPEDFVLEVGPGCGFLTLHLAAEVRELVCVEIDPRLLEVAREVCAQATNVRWIRADVLDGKHALASEVLAALPTEGPWHVVANLPYSVSAPLLVVLANLPNPPRSTTVLVQREVAERIVAAPGTSDWGPLSIRLQLDHDARLCRSVPASLFWPRPEVESTVVRLVRRTALVDGAARAELDGLVTALFQRRRQALGRVLSERVGKPAAAAALARTGLEPSARAEDLPLLALVRLSAAIGDRGGGAPP